MKIRKINLGKYCDMSMVRPFRPETCRIQFTTFFLPGDDPRRKHAEKVVVTLDLSPGEAICAIQHLRRWLKDRVDASQEDLDRGGKYSGGDYKYIYLPPED